MKLVFTGVVLIGMCYAQSSQAQPPTVDEGKYLRCRNPWDGERHTEIHRTQRPSGYSISWTGNILGLHKTRDRNCYAMSTRSRQCSGRCVSGFSYGRLCTQYEHWRPVY